MTYILILTLVSGIGQATIPTVAAVNGFESLASCERAAKNWYAEVREVMKPSRIYRATAQCEAAR